MGLIATEWSLGSVSDEVAKLAKLRDEGKITPEECGSMKQRAMS